MKKRQQKTILGGAAVLLALILVFGVALPAMSSRGMNVMSITTDATIISPSTNLETVNFIVTASIDGSGQSIVGETITPAQFKDGKEDAGGSGYESNHSLEISVEAFEESATYSILNMGTSGRLYEYSVVTIERGGFHLAECSGNPYDQWTSAKFFPYYRYCVYRDHVGQVGELSSSQVGFNALVELESGGEVVSANVSNTQQSVALRDPYTNKVRAFVSWVGSLITGNTPPNAANYKAVLSGGRWNVAHDYTWNDYATQHRITKAELSDAKSWRSPPDGAITYNNNALDELLEEDVDMVNDENDRFDVDKLNPADENNGKFVVNLRRRIANPVFTFKIKASWIGVQIPVGEPTILPIGKKCQARSGGGGVLELLVKNSGGTVGYFLPEMWCSPFYIYGTPSKTEIEAGKIEKISVSLRGGDENTELSKDCMVRVYDYNDPTMYDEATITCERLTAIQCTPDEMWIEGLCVVKCNSEGTKDEIVKCCEADQYIKIEGSDVTCIDNKVKPSCDCDWYDLKCQINCLLGSGCQWWNIKCILEKVRTAALMLAGLIGFAYSLGEMRKRFTKPKDNTLNIVVSLLVGGLIAYVTYMFYWYGLALAGILLLIKILKPI